MSLVEVKLLGPLELVVEGRPVALRRPKQRALLALLALRAGEVISTDRLVDQLWGETPPKAAVGSLQNLVSELRKLIGPELLVTRAPGYVLELDRQLVDVHRFEQAVRERGDLREALALWRGQALADLALEPFADSEILRLEELRVVAREELFDSELARGEHARLVPELEAFVSEHPLRERPRGQLMLALYRSGRQADALEAYRQARSALVEELGLEPSAELQALEQAILRHDPTVELESPAAAPPEPERRKRVTVLFSDVVESTELGARLDPEVLRGVMTRYFDVVRTVVERHGGVVEKFIGDAAMAVFGVPRLHEDDAVRAVRAARDLRGAIAALNTQLAEEYGIALQVRIGLSSGEVLVGDPSSGESFATGNAVNAAMRLQQAARPGEILIGEPTYRLARDAVEAEPVEPLDLGPLGRVAALRLLEVGDGVRPLGSAPLVGRDQELAWLRAAFAGVVAERRSRVVTVLGDAGIGKTRLATELIAKLDEARPLVGRCVSYGEGATFLPLTEIVRQAAPQRPRQTIASLLAGDEQAHLIAERIAQLSGPAEGIASTGEVFWAVRRFFEALALQRPSIVVLEDVHWAEPTLLDLVQYLAAWTASAPMLVLCLARPELLEQRPGWSSDRDTLALGPLGADEAETLVGELAGDELAGDARARVVDAAEGNPLFLEQLLALVEEAGAASLTSVPPTVDALLAGRIDRLEREERTLLERAAVVGRVFSQSAVLHLSPPEEVAGVGGRLETLIRRAFVERSKHDEDLSFRHALIRDVAYAGLTKEARTELHERHGAWLDARDEGAEEVVGYHFEQAHRYRAELRPNDPSLPTLAQRAGDRLATAGLRAWRRADTPGAINLLSRGAALLQDRSQRAETLCELGVAWQSADFGSAETALSEALTSAREAGDRRVELRVGVELAYARLLADRTADPEALIELTHETIPLLEELGDERGLGRAWRQRGSVRGSLQGRCTEWLDAAEHALRYYRRGGWSTAGCLLDLALALFHGPTPVVEGMARCEQMLEESTERLGRANVLVYLGGLHALGERYDTAFSLLDEADRIYDELGEHLTRADHSGRIRGRAHLLAGDPEPAEASFRESCAIFEKARYEAALSTVAADLGRTVSLLGCHDDARAWSRIAKEHAPAGDMISQVGWRRLEATLLAQEGQVETAENLVLDALRLLAATDALTNRGDVLLDVAFVLSSAGRPTEAASRLEEALALYELKGNAACIRVAQARLAEVAVV